MNKLLEIVTIIERLVIIAVAFAALFPLYQWLSEANSRDLQRTLSLFEAINKCDGFFKKAETGEHNLAMVDIYEHLCSEISRQITLFDSEVMERK